MFPLALAAAVDPGWSMLLWTAALFLVVEPVVGHVIEPLLYGHSTGLSPVAVVASATFWTALWGPVGLVLATPLTVCLVVLGRHVERLAFLDVMLGDRPPLSLPEIFYQRMLAEDPAEAVDKAEEFLKERPLSIYYDEVALPGLKLAQNDLARGSLDRPQAKKSKRLSTSLWMILPITMTESSARRRTMPKPRRRSKRRSRRPQISPSFAGDHLAPEWQFNTPVLCAAGRSALDEAAARCSHRCSTNMGSAHGSRARTPSPLPTSLAWKRQASRWPACPTSTPAAPPTCATPFAACAANSRTPKSFLDAGWRMAT